MKDLSVMMIMIIFIGSLIYGGYWLAKTVSYPISYEDMVVEAIKEVVKSESIR